MFPTDFSEVSKNAFIYALKLADAIHAEIITLHVYELDSPTYLDVSIYLQDIYEYEELSDFENYKDEVPLLRNIAEENNMGHIKISNVLIKGFFSERSSQAFQKGKYRLYCHGNQRSNPFAGSVFGNGGYKNNE